VVFSSAQREIDAKAVFLPVDSIWPGAAPEDANSSTMSPVSQILTQASYSESLARLTGGRRLIWQLKTGSAASAGSAGH
jgi:hypothetical protein